MDTIPIDGLAEENTAAMVPVAAAIEGGEHVLEQMDLLPEARQQAEALLMRYRERQLLHEDLLTWLKGSAEAIEALLDHGYPEEPSAEVHGDVVEDLDQNIESIGAFRARFRKRKLTVTAKFEAGPEEAA